MDLNQKFQYTIYKTTNIVNNKTYIGCHKTLNINDDYIGSGKLLKRAVKKYGRENFLKTILFVFDSPEDMFSKEKEIVDKLFVESDKTYNILIGGNGGYDYINKYKKNLYGKNGKKGFGGENLKSGNLLSEFLTEKNLWSEFRKKVSDGVKERYKRYGSHWKGKKHTEESRIKIGKKLSVIQRGENNSQYGTCWIFSDEKKLSKKVKKEELRIYLNMGWKIGRKMSFKCGSVAQTAEQ